MRWEDERYVRFYTRDTPSWLMLSWRARGLFGLLLRAVDRAGVLPVGKLGQKGLAVAVLAPWAEIEAPLAELLEDGCVVWDAGRAAFFMPNYLEAQECAQSDAARRRKSRERARAQFGGTSAASENARDALSRNGTDLPVAPDSGDPAVHGAEIGQDGENQRESRNGTTCSHEPGPDVTLSHAEGGQASRKLDPSVPYLPSRAVPSLAKPKEKNLRDSADAPAAVPLEILESAWDRTTLGRLRTAFESTRKSGSMAPGPWRSFLTGAAQYSPKIRLEAAQTYLERAYATEGKDERYLLGIMSRERKGRKGPAQSQTVINTDPPSAERRAQVDRELAEIRSRQA